MGVEGAALEEVAVVEGGGEDGYLCVRGGWGGEGLRDQFEAAERRG